MGSNGSSMGPLLPRATSDVTHTTFSRLLALVMPFSRGTLAALSMTLTWAAIAKSLRDPLVAQLLAHWVVTSPLAQVRWVEATEVGYPTFKHTTQMAAVKQYASFPFRSADLFMLRMDLNAPKVGFGTASE